ncbi:hypothetical protein SCARR_01472 [Pontiella sulfatireligans]|uniref:Uncharacterized protein n=1 Tax=Pontiella sulfatireligans TaxID=2750658 RepID=A0A6C2UJC3_9BACT|nr:hypothetical protein SCARR_01472 [Pontiella sulfatireligans]
MNCLGDKTSEEVLAGDGFELSIPTPLYQFLLKSLYMLLLRCFYLAFSALVKMIFRSSLGVSKLPSPLEKVYKTASWLLLFRRNLLKTSPLSMYLSWGAVTS